MNKQVFLDPQRKRWKRLRRIFDIVALVGVVVGVLFVIGLVRMTPLPELLLATPPAHLSAAADWTPLRPGAARSRKRPTHRKTTKKPSEITLNSGEGLRAAYYVEDDPASYSSLKQHIHQIDLLFPEWIHVVTAGRLIDLVLAGQSPIRGGGRGRRAWRRPREQGCPCHRVARRRHHARRNLSAGQQLRSGQEYVSPVDRRLPHQPGCARQFHPADRPVSWPRIRAIAESRWTSRRFPARRSRGYMALLDGDLPGLPGAQSEAVREYAGGRRRFRPEVHGGPLRRPAADELRAAPDRDAARGRSPRRTGLSTT